MTESSIRCPACDAEHNNLSRYCPDCGSELDALPETLLAAANSTHDEDSGTGSGEYGSFLPGTRLAKRYRIVSLLGKGGMGEVYRAEDLKLGQTVALKFLPRHLAGDPERLNWFHREVRLARQISHPNVCHVYDIGEFEGEHFLSMEFIDGEDLRNLLRRIGRLPREMSVHVARQICAGLIAAHECGVLLRDLKPANVMIDGKGRARITDFGLAVAPSEDHQTARLVGTPLYMAPEQFLYGETSIQSDLYAYGMVIYEAATGRPAHPADSVSDLKQLHQRGLTPPVPSTLIDDMDRELERVVVSCLQRDPTDRPGSAKEVMAALPGKDSWAADFAAGETPAPEAIANAHDSGTLRPGVAIPLLMSVLIGLCVIAWGNDRFQLIRHVAHPRDPVVLADRVRQLVSSLGYPEPPADQVYGYADTRRSLDALVAADLPLPESTDEPGTQPAALYFWYREAPEDLVAVRQTVQDPPGEVTLYDPPPLVPGMVNVIVDPNGRLLAFLRVPEADGQSGEPNWSECWSAADLNLAEFQEVPPRLPLPVSADHRMAWTGVFPGAPSVPIHVEAASSGAQIVYFQVVAPWTDPAALYLNSSQFSKPAAELFYLMAFLLAATLCAGFARYNIRAGRADVQSAWRLACYLAAARFLCWLLSVDLAWSPEAWLASLMSFLGYAVFWSAGAALCYLAVEPYIRRWWPAQFITWNRLWRGRFSDPMVGRDLLIGAALGTVWTCLDQLNHHLPHWTLGRPTVPLTLGANIDFLSTPILPLIHCQATALEEALIGFALLFLLMVILRSQKLALAIVCLIAITKLSLADPQLAMIKGLPASLMVVAVLVAALRFGPFVLAVALYYYQVTLFSPITYDLTTWYSVNGLVVAGVLAGVAGFGFLSCLKRAPWSAWLTEPLGGQSATGSRHQVADVAS